MAKLVKATVSERVGQRRRRFPRALLLMSSEHLSSCQENGKLIEQVMKHCRVVNAAERAGRS